MTDDDQPSSETPPQVEILGELTVRRFDRGDVTWGESEPEPEPDDSRDSAAAT